MVRLPREATVLPGTQTLQVRSVKLSIVIPVFNESSTIRAILQAVRAANIVDEPTTEKELIIVDDCSTDGTADLLKAEQTVPGTFVFWHAFNQGKGAAVRTGLGHATGDIILIQDADLEYDPADYGVLLRPILRGRTKVVYGSRFLGEHKAMFFWHAVGNRIVTMVTNMLYDTTLTDMETCYKVFTSEVAKKIKLTSPRWGFDPEITARILRSGFRIYEVPISYNGREYQEGKKIRGRDVLTVLWTLLKCRFTR
jgi:glycosyltransferase involved in cell wall biosynthesis